MMHKYKTIPKFSYYNFCKSVGHDYKDCRTKELMRERNSDTYRVQEEIMTGQDAHHFNQVTPSYNNAHQHYNNVQLQYNNVQPQCNPTQYN
jgi:hypothetical protein